MKSVKGQMMLVCRETKNDKAIIKESSEKYKGKLKPCPFCGGEMEPEVMCWEVQEGVINPDTIKVHCFHCGSTGGSAWTKKEAVENWNKRT